MAKEDIKEKIKRVREEEMMNEAAQLRQKERSKSHAMAVDERNKLTMTVDDRGREVTLWQKSNDSATEAMKPKNIMSYADWRSAMFGLVACYSDLVDAMNRSITNLGWEGVDLLEMGVNAAYDGLVRKFGNRPEVILPKLTHTVSLDDQNRMQFEKMNVKMTDRDGVTNDFDSNFRLAVTEWLDEEGYKPAANEANPKFVHKDTGEELTNEKFNQLRPNLDDFLSNEFDLNIRHSAQP